jgi:hypothetical protein
MAKKKVKKTELYVWVKASDIVEGSTLTTYKTMADALASAQGRAGYGEKIFVLKGSFEKVGSYKYEVMKVE